MWHLETANVLLRAERRRRISLTERKRALTTLASLPIQTDDLTSAQAWTRAADLAVDHGLTVYDASYLEAAVRLQLPLASHDAEFRRAAIACGCPILA